MQFIRNKIIVPIIVIILGFAFLYAVAYIGDTYSGSKCFSIEQNVQTTHRGVIFFISLKFKGLNFQ